MLGSLRLSYRMTDVGEFTFATQIAVCSGDCDSSSYPPWATIGPAQGIGRAQPERTPKRSRGSRATVLQGPYRTDARSFGA
jgi:hypothetical protein